MATIIDVAKEARVSTATVSNYLNNTKPVSAEKKARIDDAIDKLNYIPNFSARNLKNSFNNEIGVVFPNLNDPYYAQILQGIESHCRRNDYFVNITVSNEIPDVESDIIVNFIKKRVSGIVLVSSQPENTGFFRQNIIRNKMPFVHIDRRIKDFDAHFIYVDNYETIFRLTSMYLNEGCRKIAILAGPGSYSCESGAVEGYLKAYESCGIDADPDFIWRSVLTKEAAFKATMAMLEKAKPDAIITTSGRTAFGVLESLMFIGYKVPEDIIVASLGEDTWDINACNANIYTTMRPSLIMGKRASEILISQINAPFGTEKSCITLRDRFPGNGNGNSNGGNGNCKARLSGRAAVYGAGTASSVKSESIKVLLTQSPISEALTGLVPRFEMDTGIRADIVTVPVNTTLDHILHEQSSDDMSDIYMVDMPWFYTFADDGTIADISEFVNSPGFDRDIYLPGCFKYLSMFGNRYYGLPLMSTPQIMYYRKDLFASKSLARDFENRYNYKLHLPRTWTEFNTVSGFFTESLNPGSPVKYGTSVSALHQECIFPDIMARLWSCGGRICDDTCRVAFDSPQTLKAYSLLAQVFDCCPPDFREKDFLDNVNDFVNGDAAMLVTFHSYLSNLVDLEKICISNNIGYAHVPDKRSVLGGWSLCVSGRSRNKAAAFEFINWACGNSIANYMALLTGQSAISGIYENDELIDLYPWFPLVNEIYSYAQAVIPPFIEGRKTVPYKEIKRLLYQSVRLITDRNMPIDKVVGKTDGELRALFEACGYPQGQALL